MTGKLTKPNIRLMTALRATHGIDYADMKPSSRAMAERLRYIVLIRKRNRKTATLTKAGFNALRRAALAEAAK